MKLLIVAVALVMSVSAFAQKHMVEFGTDTQTLGALSFTDSKTKGSSATEEKSFKLTGNYAYSIAEHFQVGTRFNYSNDKQTSGNTEGYGLQVGGIYNLDTDFRSSYYASLYVGWQWGRQTQPNSGTEAMSSTVALGKRIPLSMFNLENVTYSPEISYNTTNPTKSSSTEWTQGLTFKVLQFSVFF
jgi:hypothetical protein